MHVRPSRGTQPLVGVNRSASFHLLLDRPFGDGFRIFAIRAPIVIRHELLTVSDGGASIHRGLREVPAS